MDKDILCINSVLRDANKALTTSDISKLIYERYEVKISRTIVKNYLWSFFRNIIIYDQGDFTYKLDNDKFLLEDIEVNMTSKAARPISSSIEGGKIIITADTNITIQDFIKGFAILNYKIGANKRNSDLIKQLNRVIEQLKDNQ